MQTKVRRSVAAAVLMLGASMPALAPALAAEGGGPQGQGPRHPAMGAWLQERLGLSDDQVKAIRDIRQRDAQAWRQLWQSLRQAQTELRQLALNGGDEASIQAKTAAVEQLLGQSVQMRVRHLQEISPILTPEQRQKLAEMGWTRFGPMHRGPHPQGS